MFFSQLKKNLLIYRYVYLLVVFFLCTNSYSQSISQLQKKADNLFEKQNYSAALIDFRQLLAQNPTSIQFNYKYGVCLFYSDNRKNAKRYFDFLVRQNTFPSETYYYLAKLYHFDYKFTNAILRIFPAQPIPNVPPDPLNSPQALKDRTKGYR